MIELSDDSDGGQFLDEQDDEIQFTDLPSLGSRKGKERAGPSAGVGTVTYGSAYDPVDEFADLPSSAFDLDMSDDIVPLPLPGRSAKGNRSKKPSSPPPAYHEIDVVSGPSRFSGRRQPPPSSRTDLAHPWSRECLSVLNKVFHLPSFRPNQLEAINGTLSGQDVFVLMPTGGGKSLCYQLPSQVHSGKTSGVTIIISPLISLIHDQVHHLKENGIPAIPFTGDLPASERKAAMFALNGGTTGNDRVDGIVVYVTPEMLGKSATFQSLLRSIHRKGKLARFVVDEAHCLSSVRRFASFVLHPTGY